nr:hypothetical protein GTC16762_08170 [Pigmentibacter ruber]
MTLEKVSCDFCGSTNNIIVASQKDLLYKTTNELFHVVKCTDCQLNFTNPRPDKDSIKNFYV